MDNGWGQASKVWVPLHLTSVTADVRSSRCSHPGTWRRHDITSLIVNRIRYVILAWGGFVTAELRGTINAVFRTAFRYGFCNKLLSVEQTTEVADCRFFTAIQHPEHCINNCILPDVNECSADLRRKRHQYKLPQYKYDIYRKLFIPRCLFGYI